MELVGFEVVTMHTRTFYTVLLYCIYSLIFYTISVKYCNITHIIIYLKILISNNQNDWSSLLRPRISTNNE